MPPDGPGKQQADGHHEPKDDPGHRRAQSRRHQAPALHLGHRSLPVQQPGDLAHRPRHDAAHRIGSPGRELYLHARPGKQRLYHHRRASGSAGCLRAAVRPADQPRKDPLETVHHHPERPTHLRHPQRIRRGNHLGPTRVHGRQDPGLQPHRTHGGNPFGPSAGCCCLAGDPLDRPGLLGHRFAHAQETLGRKPARPAREAAEGRRRHETRRGRHPFGRTLGRGAAEPGADVPHPGRRRTDPFQDEPGDDLRPAPRGRFHPLGQHRREPA